MEEMVGVSQTEDGWLPVIEQTAAITTLAEPSTAWAIGEDGWLSADAIWFAVFPRSTAGLKSDSA